MNKRQNYIYEKYCESMNVTLRDVYNNYSVYKERAYERCTKRFLDMQGQRFRIISFNSQMFSIGFRYYENNKLMFHYESNKSMQDWSLE